MTKLTPQQIENLKNILSEQQKAFTEVVTTWIQGVTTVSLDDILPILKQVAKIETQFKKAIKKI